MADYSKDFTISYDEARGSCTIRFRCFDTPNTVTVFGDVCPGADAEDMLMAVRRECLEFHMLWSFSCAGSDVVRINEPVKRVRVDVRTALLISAMKAFHDAEPLFDFTVGPISYAWKHAKRVPDAGELSRALAHVGAGKVSVEGDMIVKSDPLAQVDVGGAAKGFVADSIAARLHLAGIEHAEIDLGGNLFMLGSHPSGRPWHVAVRIPKGVDVERPVISVCDQSVVTSGSYERFTEIDGKRYQHIIDAATGQPSESDIISATVVTSSSLQADMLATTALLAGSHGLPALVARHPEARILAITDKDELVSPS